MLKAVLLIYSRISMALTSLGPWKCVLNKGCSNHLGLIIVPNQEANGNNLAMSFLSSIKHNGMLSIFIRIASTRRF